MVERFEDPARQIATSSPTVNISIVTTHSQLLFDSGHIKESFAYLDAQLLKMEDSANAELEGGSRISILNLRLHYAKLLIKTGFLV